MQSGKEVVFYNADILTCLKFASIHGVTFAYIYSTVFNSRAVSFNRALDVCKLTGAVLFCVGGTSMAVGLLLSAFAKSYSKEELYLQQKFKERLADLQATVGESLVKGQGIKDKNGATPFSET